MSGRNYSSGGGRSGGGARGGGSGSSGSSSSGSSGSFTSTSGSAYQSRYGFQSDYHLGQSYGHKVYDSDFKAETQAIKDAFDRSDGRL
ncbi:hypothetical protein HK105_201059 [Polyrhizophydium stewartii]|uniref:Uncharacterized protein n=1 Tax=Polyrhizophydium stewartii TaxID=2732419 RepID=A0ABR4NJ02_9FUNG